MQCLEKNASWSNYKKNKGPDWSVPHNLDKIKSAIIMKRTDHGKPDKKTFRFFKK